MLERTTALVVEPNTRDSLASLPGRNAASEPQRAAFTRKNGGGWSDVTAAAFNDDVRALAKGLIQADLAAGRQARARDGLLE